MVANSFSWLAEQPRSRPSFNVDRDFLLRTFNHQ
jgi:hypothetical protein